MTAIGELYRLGLKSDRYLISSVLISLFGGVDHILIIARGLRQCWNSPQGHSPDDDLTRKIYFCAGVTPPNAAAGKATASFAIL